MRRSLSALLLAIACGVPARAQTGAAGAVEGQPLAQDLKRLTIEELSQIDVTSVSRRPEKISETAAAISVIGAEELRRSGVTSLAEAMRLGAAVDVVRVNPNTWAVTSRGFQISTANKLLVLVDGRTVYSPLFSGTFWEVQELVFDDVDRIESIRGPGGALWGANAVNGVVNVITKPASRTRGGFAMITTGSDEHAIVSGRYGARMGDGDYRVYGKFRQRNAGVNGVTGSDEGNGLLMGHGGFRLDSDQGLASRWSVQGEIYRGAVGLVARPDGDLAGGNLIGRYARRYSATSELTAEAYYDRTWRRIPQQFEEVRDTVAVHAQQRLMVADRHDLVFGGDARISHGRDKGVAGFFFEPEQRTNQVFSAFVQDEFALRPSRLYLILGTKLEGNDYTGMEVQPTARVRWMRNSNQMLWGAVSRAVRLPTRFDTDLRIVNPVTRQVLISGSEDFKAESVVAYEAGYRIRPHSRVALDLAAFANRYDDLRSQELPGAPGQPVTLRNLLNAVTSGAELSATFQPIDRWRLQGSYAYLYEDFSVDQGSTDPFDGMFEANDPSHMFSLRSYTDLPAGFQLDAVFRSIGSRPTPRVPAYSELDLRLGWTLRPGWELSLGGQNLLHDRHTEFASQGSPPYAFERAGYLRSVWRF
jgi:iron complex outermembrane recepter protein